MPKTRGQEANLLRVVNERIALARPGAQTNTCCVEALRPTINGPSNFAVDTVSFSGADLNQVVECDELIAHVMRDVASSYEVAWEAEA